MKNFILLSLIFLAAAACKKNEAEPAPVVPPPTPVQNAPYQSGIGSNVNKLHGFMMVNIIEVPSISMVMTQTLANFNTNAQKYSYYYWPEKGAIPYGANAGVLKCNSDTVPFNANVNPGGTGGFYFNYDVGSPNTATWELSALSPFTSFTTTVTRGFPVLTNMNFIQDSASVAGSLTIQFNTIYSNTDSLLVMISDGQSHYFARHLAGNAVSVNFSSTEVAQLTPGNLDIQVMASNYSNQIISGKNYIYVMQKSIMDNIFLH